jgi:hypothetical protein
MQNYKPPRTIFDRVVSGSKRPKQEANGIIPQMFPVAEGITANYYWEAKSIKELMTRSSARNLERAIKTPEEKSLAISKPLPFPENSKLVYYSTSTNKNSVFCLFPMSHQFW